MPDTPYEFLTKFFTTDLLPFTPTPGQVDTFKSDLTLISPYLMEAALVEIKEGIQGHLLRYAPENWRAAIFRIYNRKVAEHAQLFPIFHTFETAFRSTVATAMEVHYQHPRWWRGIYEALRNGKPTSTITQIGGTPLSRDVAHLIVRLIYAIDGDDFRRDIISAHDNGYQFLECCDLIHIRQLIENHWASIFAARFTCGSRKLTVADFKAKFDRVREARNDIYHHKSLAGMTNVVSAAEELLDFLNCSLDFIYTKIADSAPAEPVFTMAIEGRHRTW